MPCFLSQDKSGRGGLPARCAERHWLSFLIDDIITLQHSTPFDVRST